MKLRSTCLALATLVAASSPFLPGCSDPGPGTGSGGTATGGSPDSGGGPGAGGAPGTGGAASGGQNGSGGAAAGGSASGGQGSGGLGTGGGTSGSGGSAGPTPTFETLKEVISGFVTTPCSASDCHGGHVGHIDLRPDEGLYQRLISSSSEICGMPIIDPEYDPDNSALVVLLKGPCGIQVDGCSNVGSSPDDPGVSCLPPMPAGCVIGEDCVPQAYIDAISLWVASGAPEQ